jgi:endonuclease YncB( thermonuclease family)
MNKNFLMAALVLCATPVFAEDAPAPVAAAPAVAPAQPEQITKLSGQVTEINSSIIFKMKDDKGEIRTIRLAQIGTPYANKPYGKESIEALKNLIADKKVDCDVMKTDRFGKNIAVVTCDQKSIQAAMVEGGHAWVNKRYGTPELVALQDKAKEAKRGLWALPQPPIGFGTKGMRADAEAAKTEEATKSS